MTTGGPSPDQKVWRYMPFSRFVWLLQNKQLWLSRADLLDDEWEIALAGEQLEHVIARHPITPLPEVQTETALKRSKRIITTWRRQTFVSCWSISEHESHALWRIYCGASEGIAIQTTLARLRQSVGGLPVYRVTYETPGANRRTPTLVDLVTKKRPMFAYECEVRVVHSDERPDWEHELGPLGRRVDWDPERHIEQVRVHLEADSSFMEVATAVVQHYAPTLAERIAWSAMKARPPF
jgi:hypothetical protein